MDNETEQKIPFRKAFGDLCFEYAMAAVRAEDLRRGLMRRDPDETEKLVLDKPGRLSEQIYQLAAGNVLETDATDRERVVEDVVLTMVNNTVYTSRNMAFDKTKFVTTVLLRALEISEAKNNPLS